MYSLTPAFLRPSSKHHFYPATDYITVLLLFDLEIKETSFVIRTRFKCFFVETIKLFVFCWLTSYKLEFPLLWRNTEKFRWDSACFFSLFRFGFKTDEPNGERDKTRRRVLRKKCAIKAKNLDRTCQLLPDQVFPVDHRTTSLVYRVQFLWAPITTHIQAFWLLSTLQTLVTCLHRSYQCTTVRFGLAKAPLFQAMPNNLRWRWKRWEWRRSHTPLQCLRLNSFHRTISSRLTLPCQARE